VNLEEFKRKHKKEIDHYLIGSLLNALTIELQKIWGEKRFLGKIEAIVKKINTQFNKDLPLIFEAVNEKGLQDVLNEIEDIGLFFDSPDLRGLHRRKQIPSSKILLKEYDELHKRLKGHIKRKYINLNTKKVTLKNILDKFLNSDNPQLIRHIECWMNLPLSEIAMSALGLKYGVSASKIKKALNRRKILEKLELVKQ